VKLLRLAVLATFVSTVAGASEASASPPAAASEVSQIISSVEKKYSQVHTIQAAFTQAKRDTFGAMQQDGDVVLQRPARMRWRFTSGDQSEFVTDGDTLWIYTKADNQVLRMRDTSAATTTANSFLTSLDSLDEMFTVTLVGRDGGPTLDLVPREAGMYKTIRLSLDTALVLRGIVFTDVYDNVTELSFRDVRLNGQVDAAAFKFVPPAGATVVDN
jgi:outer membrane lipoprotein carrier protein